ncbi:serine/threonine-protein phosphatase 7 long form-like [Heracleum sosnowskyi]|uniref:Serine/threonine-protein phosphatase 7 long form-like n=1 Tax=Heracleum sosnowskyi TaxID=360622 RepID=A0AAD8M9A2_9APIA|nr:serine/threonine-protein phosphatase 7 long form-like [Heracleum sosnowskyi]
MDPDNELSMSPGLRDPSVLHLQSIHRSTSIWKASFGDTQRLRKRNPTHARFPKLHQRMIPILLDLIFDGVSRISSINIDWNLITALIERWRLETHTFHLPVGESNITLQDVSLLLVLRVDGAAVTSITIVDGGWDHIIEEIFG